MTQTCAPAPAADEPARGLREASARTQVVSNVVERQLEARRTAPNERQRPRGVDHRASAFPSGEDWYRSSDQKFVSSPASLNDSAARIVYTPFVKRALAVQVSTGSHTIAGSISVAGAITHMSLNSVTVTL